MRLFALSPPQNLTFGPNNASYVRLPRKIAILFTNKGRMVRILAAVGVPNLTALGQEEGFRPLLKAWPLN